MSRKSAVPNGPAAPPAPSHPLPAVGGSWIIDAFGQLIKAADPSPETEA